MLDPPLTTMNVSKKQIGQWAMKLIVDRRGNLSRPAVKCSVGGTLVVRASVKKLESRR
jgi:DNA-binding LacI/PurR family transcriptional regulator